MCRFFSCISNGKGKLYYFDSKLRKELKNSDYDMDSHTSIADYFQLNEDKCNKYEYNPLTKAFTRDQMNTRDDSEIVQKQLDKMDWKMIVPELMIKDIIHPFKDFDRKRVTRKDIENLKKWRKVVFSVRYSVWYSVENSVRYSLWVSLRDSFGDSFRDSLWVSLRDSFGDSLWDSAYGYLSSFFKIDWKYIKHKKGENPFQCCIDLWEHGLFPCTDGEYWYLMGGHEANILWKGKL